MNQIGDKVEEFISTLGKRIKMLKFSGVEQNIVDLSAILSKYESKQESIRAFVNVHLRCNSLGSHDYPTHSRTLTVST